MPNVNVVVLAAGKGTRMYSAKPKVLHELAGKSLLQHTLDTARALAAASIQVVIGHEAERIRRALDGQALGIVLQTEQRGTAHAVHQALSRLDREAIALVLYGDVPLIRAETLNRMLATLADNPRSMAVLTCTVDNPSGLGRILRDANGAVQRIVEEKDADAAQRSIREINTGIMAIPVACLHDWLPRIKTDNAQGEYYLTDVVRLALDDGCQVHTVACDDALEASGVNDRRQLATLERHYQRREANRLLLAGVTLRDPARIDIRGEVEVAQDVEIDINVILEGVVKIAAGVKVGPNCVLKNCDIGAGCEIAANSVLEDAVIGRECRIGPFARIRPGTTLGEQARVGNFVEIKQSTIGAHSKVNHLSYVGDSELGSAVNVGAGTITCNYDGVNKHRTIVGDGVFIGSNSALVAPVAIADGATVAAGSIITKNVARGQLAIARGRQSNIDGWNKPRK